MTPVQLRKLAARAEAQALTVDGTRKAAALRIFALDARERASFKEHGLSEQDPPEWVALADVNGWY
jgi:hypothetical protein